MSKADKTYLSLAEDLLDQVDLAQRDNRTDTPTGAIFGTQLRFNLAEEFPILTTKQVHFPSVVSELLWFLKGYTNIKYLLEHNNHIWTDWRYKEYLNHAKEYEGIEEPISIQEFEKLILADPDVAAAYGSIGKGYGHQWRNFGNVQEFCEVTASLNSGDGWYDVQEGFDQISWVINEIKTNPNSRRLIVSGWNPHEVNQVDLPPCHTLFQFFVSPLSSVERLNLLKAKAVQEKWISKESDRTDKEWLGLCDDYGIPRNKLSCQLYQRSADYFLGVPFNIASYALLTHLIADTCGLGVGDFVWTGGDTHLYVNHKEAMMQQLDNLHAGKEFAAPQLKINWNGKSIFELEPADISLENYQHAGKIKAPVAV